MGYAEMQNMKAHGQCPILAISVACLTPELLVEVLAFCTLTSPQGLLGDIAQGNKPSAQSIFLDRASRVNPYLPVRELLLAPKA